MFSASDPVEAFPPHMENGAGRAYLSFIPGRWEHEGHNKLIVFFRLKVVIKGVKKKAMR